MKKVLETIEQNIEIFKEILHKINSYSELCEFYKIQNNGKGYKFFKDIISKYNLSTSHWNWRLKTRKYERIEKICPICKSKFITEIGCRDEKTVCSLSCSNTFFSNIRHTERSKKKLSKTLKKLYDNRGRKPLFDIICIVCGKEKSVKKNTQKCCSNKCGTILRNQNPIYRQHLKEGVQRAIREGRHKPWTSRNIVSYPEKFFMDVLKNNNIQYKHNLLCGKYFIDFGIENKKIALEIDGKQHKYPDRIIKDQEKDKFLTEQGWTVYRLEWNSINTDDGKKLMKEKINKFLEILK